jgi:aspartyl/glutamyl-tRNA(Asn/Gln) amidotransferase C subunit
LREKIDIKHLTKLANLDLNDDEIAGYENDLDRIIEFVSIIDEFDINKNHESDDLPKSNFREDKPKKNISQSEAFRNAKKVKDDFFVVPKILDNK